MTPTLQQKIYHMLLFGLRPEGYLFLGSSENPLPILKSLKVIDKSLKIYKKLDSIPSVSFDAFTVPEYTYFKPASLGTSQPQTTKIPDRTLDGAITETIFEEEQSLLICIDENNKVLKSYGPTSRFMHQKNFTSDLTELLPKNKPGQSKNRRLKGQNFPRCILTASRRSCLLMTRGLTRIHLLEG